MLQLLSVGSELLANLEEERHNGVSLSSCTC